MAGEYTKRKIKYFWLKVKAKHDNGDFSLRRLFLRLLFRKKSFSVISNNCWAGRLYQYLDMPYLSPTAGLYFFAPDYIKFVSDLHRYLDMPLEFINPENSKYYEELKKRNQTDKPIGILDDVEIVFLHYKTKEEAKEKWDRRKARVNYDHIILKFSRMNLCTDSEIEQFCSLPFDNKFVFNTNENVKYPCEIFWKGTIKNNEIVVDTKPFPGQICLRKLLNKPANSYIKKNN